MSEKSYPYERKGYRHYCPRSGAPELLIDKSRYAVVDMCEQGIRFRMGRESHFEVGRSLMGTLLLQSGKSRRIKGEVIRVLEDETVLSLSAKDGSIPLSLLMEEQRRNIKRFRHLK